MANEGYEFNAVENRLIADLARKMSSVGFFLVAVGLLSLAGVGLGLATGRPGYVLLFLLAGAFFLATGIWTVRAARAFQAVVDTEGNDIELVMCALRELDRFYTLSFWLVMAYVLTILLTLSGCPGSLG